MGQLVAKAVLIADDGEAEDEGGVVEEVEALGAGLGGEAGDDGEVAGGADGEAEVGGDGAALDEVLVDLGLVEPAEDGPDDRDGGGDLLGEEGGGLVAAGEVVGVELGHRGAEGLELFRGQA